MGMKTTMQHLRHEQRSHTGLKHAGLGVMLALALAGCGRLGLNDPLAERPQPTYEPLPAVPTAPVTSSALPPPPVTSAPLATTPGISSGTPVDPMAPTQPSAGTAAGIPVASATTAPSAAPDKGGPAIGRGELAGGWRLSSSADNCQLFITLTTWSGGYRASTKGCNSAEFQRISAWDVSGRQVFLKSGDGAVVATLTSAGQEKYAGSTTSRQSVSLSR